MRTPIWLISHLIVVTVLSVTTLAAPPRYDVVDIGTLGGPSI
jgi:hypothetical protein